MALAEQVAVQYRAATPGQVFTSRLQHAVKPAPAEDDTLSKGYLRRVAELGATVAQRKKRYGIWQEYTWNEVY